jgi:hypothetical protein
VGQGHAQGVEHSWYGEHEWTSYDSDGNVRQRTYLREWGYVDEQGNRKVIYEMHTEPGSDPGKNEMPWSLLEGSLPPAYDEPIRTIKVRIGKM